MNESCLIDIAIAKTEKYASRESGDTVELIERPRGGVSVVMIDGQGSGRAAKTLSLLLSSKAVALVKEGVRDGVVARATHDYLFAFRHGQVSATLDLLSIDLKTSSIVITRNAEAPMLIADEHGARAEPTTAGPIGRYQWTKPVVTELPMRPGIQLALFTDGISHAGRRKNLPTLDFDAVARSLFDPSRSAQQLADAMLALAMERDGFHPGDDMAVVAVSLVAVDHAMTPVVRRMQAQIPVP